MAKRKFNAPPRQPVPLVSVIIPLYNAEKYIGKCLDSLLAQTFTNFEVIVVDDCSTDKSCAVVESYAEKFNGRLKLSHMVKNSGAGSLPRNKGLTLSRGEYIFNMDNDDAITPTALEELYTLAKNHDAEVVYCEKYYEADENLANVRLTSSQKKVFVDKPTFETDIFTERLARIRQYFFVVMPWLKLIKRDLLTEYEIVFPNIIRDDDVWTWNLVFRTKKFLRVPNAVYIWRNVNDSITRLKRTAGQQINFWLNPVILGAKTLNEIMGTIEFFKKNPQYRYVMLSFFIEKSFSILLKFSFELEPFAVYQSIDNKFSKNLGEHDVLVAALCTIINTQQKNFAVNARKFQQFAAQAQARIAQLETQLKTK